MDWGQKCPTQPKLFLVSAGAISVRVGQNEFRPSWSYLQPPVGNRSRSYFQPPVGNPSRSYFQPPVGNLSWSYFQPPVGNLSWPYPKGKECEKGSEPESRCEETAFRIQIV